MAADNPCPRCGARRPAGAPAGHCPQCLLRLGLGAELSIGSHGRPARTTGPPRDGSVLTLLEGAVGPVPRVLLRDTEVGPVTPVVRPGPGAGQADSTGRYQLLGEIARGGMGSVLKGRDNDLGRDLAVKVLLDQHRDNPELVRRFVEEAQIGGQLQHPGIVPIYELGTFPDLRPYFAMKLVKGRTLAAMLEARRDPADDRPRMLGVFEQVCQTVAYAHARGVIHRDLKPSNVMVGSFGEVQVMDWGLAKVLVAGGAADDERSMKRSAESVIQTVRSGSAADASLAGSLLGTPAYMAPEQARGEVDALDERADVFGLGAILCEILTGQPPYVGRNSGEVQRLAARAELDDARTRLDASGADPELLALARLCLTADPKQRPRDAGEVALTMRQYFNGVQERLRRAELGRVEAQARAEEERKRRRLTVALAASVITLFGLAGGGGAWLAHDRASRLDATQLVVNAALDEASLLRGRARQAPPGDLSLWVGAIAAARRADGLLARGDGDAALRTRVSTLLAALSGEERDARDRAAELDRDRRMVDRLEKILDGFSDHRDRPRRDREFAAAFRDYGIDIDGPDPVQAGRRIAGRSVASDLAAAIDNWVFTRRAMSPPDVAGARRLVAVAKAADPDPWRNRVRDAIARKGEDRSGILDELRGLAREADVEHAPVASVHRLALALWDMGDRELAVNLLRTVQQSHPDGFGVNSDLGFYLAQMGPPAAVDAVRFLTTAVALRPRNAYARCALGRALSALGRTTEAIVALREAVRLAPDVSFIRRALAAELTRNGQADAPIEQLREAVRLDRGDAWSVFELAKALIRKGEIDEGIALYREAARLKPENGGIRGTLAGELLENGDPAGAIEQYREAIRLEPRKAEWHNKLAQALGRSGRTEEAIERFHEAARLEPRNARFPGNLAVTLLREGRLEEAMVAFRQARELAEPGTPLARIIENNIRSAERRIALAPRLPALLRGEDHPRDGVEGRTAAKICYDRRLFTAAARFWHEAFAAEPGLAGDRDSGNRYDGACAAALAAAGQGKDDPPPDEGARAALRKQALDWLRADLAAWSKLLEVGQPQSRDTVRRTLAHWKRDHDLADVRGAAALARLTVEEQEAWRTLWVEVDSLLKKAR